MATGDVTLDEILRQLRASEGAPQPATPVAPATPAVPTESSPRSFRFGRGAARFLRGFGGKFGGSLAAGSVLAEGLTGEPTISNAIRTGVGVGALVAPAVGLPLAAGMTAANLIPDTAYDKLLGTTPTDIRGPATMAFLRRGGRTTPDLTQAVAPVPAPQPSVPAAPTIPAAPAVSAAPAALDAEQILGENYFQPPSGTGAIRFGKRPARVIDTRTSSDTTPSYAGPRGVGGFAGALLGLKQISGNNAVRAARARAAAADLAARGTAARGAAALQTSELSARLAREYLQKNPGDFVGASAVLSGRSQGGTTPFRESTTTLPDIKTGAITVIDTRTGVPKRVIPTAPVQDITLAEAIASAKRAKTYKTDAQVRADLAKLPGYRLVD